MTSLRIRAAALVGLSLFLVGASGCGGSKKNAKGPLDAKEASGQAEVGKPAPDLSVDTVNGKGKISLESLSGKIAVIDFWATWCAPCKQSFPKLEELAKQNQGKIEVIGISVDDAQDGVADFAKKNGATFAIGWDSGHSIANRWGVKETMPTTYVLDGTGTVRFIHSGYHDDEAEKIGKEIATLSEESGTKVAKGGDAKGDSKGDTKGDSKGDTTTASAGSEGGGDSGDSADPPAKKPPAKKPGKGAGKPPGGKPPGKKPPKKK